MLILKVILTVTLMICIMLIGFVIIARLELSSNMFAFFTMFWLWLCLYVPKKLFKENDNGYN